MSRSGYVDDLENWQLIMWRGAVKSAMRGKRGQAFFKEALAALDAMPEKRLIANTLEADGEFCLLGALGHHKNMDVSKLDPEDSELVSDQFNIADALAREAVFMNDEGAYYDETPEQRWIRMRKWVESNIEVKDD